MLTYRDWTCAWEGKVLVLALPGWIQPTPVIVAIQAGLFD